MSGNVRERIVDTNDGKGTFHIYKQQDCEKILKAIGDYPTYLRRKRSTQDAHKLLGTVPNLLAVSWADEWGVRLYSKEWLERVKKRLKHDPNWKSLRVDYST